MKKYIVTICLCFISIYGYSQENYAQEPGKVTQYEMAMTEYEPDKDAEALVIYDKGDYYFQGHNTRGFLLYMKKIIKIKILKQAGISYADFEIPYYEENNEFEIVDDIKGTTYNLEGGQLIKTELDNKKIFEEKINNNIKVKKIAMPDIREGSVIEFSYTVCTPYFFNMRQWEFQKKIPVVYSQLIYKAIPYYEYIYIIKGTNKLDEYKSEPKMNNIRYGNLQYREMEYTFGMKNLPAFRDEEYITSTEDHMISLNFQLSKQNFSNGGNKDIMTTWPAMCDDFLKDDYFGKYIKQSEKEAKKILPTLGIEDKSELEKAQEIAIYVKSNFNWNGIYSKYAKTKLSDFLKQKTGNVSNINLFLVGMLREAKLEVYPVVLSTRKNGIIRKSYPFQQFMNYVIAQVRIDGKVYNIDSTEPLLYFNDMPERCINMEGLVIKPKTEEWTTIMQKGVSLDSKNFELNILPEENFMEVKAVYIGIGYNAYNYRSIYLGKTSNLTNYLKENSNINIKGDIEISNNNKELNKALRFNFSFDTSIENANGKLFINPFCNLAISNNPFKQTSRTLPIDLMYLSGKNYQSTINIPEGYKVEHLPEIYTSDDNLIKINYMIQKSDDKIIISAGYMLKRNMYIADEYNSLKMSFAEIIKRFSDMVVLVKE